MTIINQTFCSNSDDIKIKNLFSQLLNKFRRLRLKDVKKTVLLIKINIVKDDNNKFKCHHYYKQEHNETKYQKKHSKKKLKKTDFRDIKSKQQNTEDNEEVILIIVYESLLYNEKKRELIQQILDSKTISHICSNKTLFLDLESYTVLLR